MANRLYPPLWVDCVCFVCRCIQFCTESVHTFHALQYIDIPRVTYIQLSHIKIVIDTQQNIFVGLVILTNWVEQKSIPKPHFCCCFFAMPISMRCTYTQYTIHILYYKARMIGFTWQPSHQFIQISDFIFGYFIWPKSLSKNRLCCKWWWWFFFLLRKAFTTPLNTANARLGNTTKIFEP